MLQSFRIALTADFFEADGSPKFKDMGVSAFEAYKWLEIKPLNKHYPEINPDQLGCATGIIVLTPSVTAKTMSGADNLLAIGRFGVGYDSVDVAACTEANVAVFITAGAVDRSMAEATIGWMIGLCHHVRIKDNLVRTGGWDVRANFMGSELRDHTFGAVGLGSIARKTIELLNVFDMNQPIAYDPFVDESDAAALGVQLVGLDHLMAEADFVSVHCPLFEATQNLIGKHEIGFMKPTAFLINTARGGIVHEDALFSALENKLIAGAAIDCFVDEPVTTPHRLGQFDNVLLAPHCISWTHELFRDIGKVAFQGMIDLAQGKKPRGVVNPDVFNRPSFQEKWQRLQVQV